MINVGPMRLMRGEWLVKLLRAETSQLSGPDSSKFKKFLDQIGKIKYTPYDLDKFKSSNKQLAQSVKEVKKGSPGIRALFGHVQARKAPQEPSVTHFDNNRPGAGAMHNDGSGWDSYDSYRAGRQDNFGNDEWEGRWML